MQQLGASLVVSTYQANKLLAVRASGPGLSTLVRTFDKPMGLAVEPRRPGTSQVRNIQVGVDEVCISEFCHSEISTAAIRTRQVRIAEDERGGANSILSSQR